MAYQALYRTHRPQTFDQLIGQAAVKRVLLQALAQDKLAHAFLFTGPRGTGKTTVARLVAKAVNCTGATPEQPICDQCAACKSITDGSSLDVVEIDAASNRSIEDIRALRERVGYPPQELKKKVYIIDEVHMLSREAFNALLKTLEEPPAHALFILATTEADKVPVTIQSRCQRLEFRQATLADLAEQLQKVAALEGVTLTPEAVSVLIELAEGGFRDALSLLERVISIGDTVTEEGVRELFGLGEVQWVRALIGALLDQDRQLAFRCVMEAEERGHSPVYLTQSVIRQLRHLLYVGVGAQSPADDWETQQAPRLPLEQLYRWLGFWLEARAECRQSPLPFVPLEIAVAECLTGATVTAAPLPAAPAPRPLVVAAPVAPPVSSSSSAEISGEQWQQIAKAVEAQNHAVGKLLLQATVAPVVGGRLPVSVQYAFHVEQLAQPANFALVAKAIQDVVGEALSPEFQVKGSAPVVSIPPEEVATVEDVLETL